ncbi:MAG: hypothetical protein ABSE41_11760 [Bacteroidota bacterium]|jgi:hypothetical protein
MTRFFKYLLAISVVTGSFAQAQSGRSNRAVATITASATVVGNVDLIVMKDMDYELSSLSPADLTVNPQNDSRAGQMKIIGSPNSLVRVTFERQSILRHESGGSQLYFAYNLSGGPDLIQRESILLTQNNQIRLSDQGVYYLWVGGRLSGIENIVPGNYYMELSIELEYIL